MSSSKFNFSQSDRILKIGGHILFIFIALIIVVSEESPLMSPLNILNKYQKTSELINAAKGSQASQIPKAPPLIPKAPPLTSPLTSKAPLIQQAAKASGITAIFNLT